MRWPRSPPQPCRASRTSVRRRTHSARHAASTAYRSCTARPPWIPSAPCKVRDVAMARLAGDKNLVERPRQLEAKQAGAFAQPRAVFVELEDLAIIGALPFENAACVMERMSEDVDPGIAPGKKLPVHPDPAVAVVKRTLLSRSLARRLGLAGGLGKFAPPRRGCVQRVVDQRAQPLVEHCETGLGRALGAGDPARNVIHALAVGGGKPTGSEYGLDRDGRSDLVGQPAVLACLGQSGDNARDLGRSGTGR